MLFVLFIPIVTAHLIQNRVQYPIIVKAGEECVEPLNPNDDIELDFYPGDVVLIQNHLGMLLGKIRIWDDVHNSTLIDSEFMRSQLCKDVDTSGKCQEKYCRQGKGWMMVMCAKTCSVCHLQQKERRCNKTQLGITDNYMVPGFLEKTIQQTIEYGGQKINNVPPIVLFENFISPDDNEELLKFAIGSNLKRSTGQGKIDNNGIQEKKEIHDRTSTNAWCMGKCGRIPAMIRLRKKVSLMLGIPENNFEAAQILRYDEGQLYATHNDIGVLDFKSPAGPRVFTMFVYLNNVEKGGETDFPRLPNTLVKPRSGQAVLWSSVQEVNGEFIPDPRTDHQAKPPLNGNVKYGMNIWVHARAFKIANIWGCTVSVLFID